MKPHRPVRRFLSIGTVEFKPMGQCAWYSVDRPALLALVLVSADHHLVPGQAESASIVSPELHLLGVLRQALS